MSKVIKRDGRRVEFSKAKIESAILKAFKSVDGTVDEYAELKARNIADYIEAQSLKVEMSIEEIQDLVENGLMATKRKDVAKAYITYRDERTRMRNRNSSIRKKQLEKLTASNVKNQNANVDEYSFGGRIGEAGRVALKDIALNDIMSEMARDNHLNNEIYIHDLDSYAAGMHNCLSVPFDDLLANGFTTRQTDVRPANSVSTAFQLVAVIFQLQSLMQFGGVSATHLDWTMVPYVRKSFYKHYCDGVKYVSKKSSFWIPDGIGDTKIKEDKWKDMSDFMCKWFKIDDIHGYSDIDAYKYAIDKTKKEIHQAIEAMYHNLNTLQSRSGDQLKRMAG